MPRIHDIPGGIHPPQNKSQSLGRPIQSTGLPDKLMIPLAQHIGAPAEPLVAVGDRVLKGQPLGKAPGFVSAPCHAPTSGRVEAIGEHPVPHPSGLSSTCITLRPDGEDQWAQYRGSHRYLQLEKPQLLEILRDAGIVGMGGAGFPTPVKLATDKPIESLIINGTECEPYITADDKLMQERAEDIVEGVRILRHLLSPQQTVIGIEDNKPDAVQRMREAAADSDIDVVTFPTKYPSGGEKQLIQILTGKEVPSGGLPADVGIVLQNVGTAYAVFRAIRYDEPLISRIVTVTGNNVARPGNYEVLIGTPVAHLLQICGFDPSRSERLIMGGPMMGFALTSTSVPIVKTTNCILAPAVDELPSQSAAQACIRCGMCAQACPASLLPQQMFWFAQGKEYDKLEEHNLFDCIECGCCSYVCPSNIPLVQYYRASKATISERKLDVRKSEHAKTRFEARQQRLEEELAQKQARRKARSKKAPRKPAAAKAPPPGAAPVKQAPAQQEQAKEGPTKRGPTKRGPTKRAPTDSTATPVKAPDAEGVARPPRSDRTDEVLAAITRVRARDNAPPASEAAEKGTLKTRTTPSAVPEQGALPDAERQDSKSSPAPSVPVTSPPARPQPDASSKQSPDAAPDKSAKDAVPAAVKAEQSAPAQERQPKPAATTRAEPGVPAPALTASEQSSAAKSRTGTEKLTLAQLQARLNDIRIQHEQARRAGNPESTELEAQARRLERQLLDRVQRSDGNVEREPKSPTGIATPNLDRPPTSAARPASANRQQTANGDAQLTKLEARLAAAREILAQASADNSPKRDAFAQTVAALEQQVRQARETD